MAIFNFRTLGSVACLIAGLWCLFGISTVSTDIKSQELAADVVSRDIGTLRQREMREVHFTLRNAADAVLSLESVHTSCGCTKWQLSERRLEPGATADLSAVFDSGETNGNTAVSIRVSYKNLKSENTGNLFLTLLAEVQPDYQVYPSVLTFSPAEDFVQTILIESCFDADLQLLEAVCSRDCFVAEIEKNYPQDSQIVIKVKFQRDKWIAGEKCSVLELKTNSKRQPNYNIPLVIQIP